MNLDRPGEPPRQDLWIDADDVHIWLLPCVQPGNILQDLFAILDADERKRANRYRFDHHRVRFIASISNV